MKNIRKQNTLVTSLNLLTRLALLNGGLEKEVDSLTLRLLENEVALLKTKVAPPNDLTQEEHVELMAGHKIPAIKLYRMRTNTGLGEAKQFIEKKMDENQAYMRAYNDFNDQRRAASASTNFDYDPYGDR